MARPKLQLRIAQSPVLRYGLAVLSVSVALGGALLIERLQLRNITLFLFAIALAAWYGGTGAAVLALLLSYISFSYFFVEPSHSIPYFILFALFAWLVSWFSSVRRRVEAELLAERTQPGSLLNLTHDSVFVRNMDFAITYWNLGAQELYGWAAEDAIGKHSNQLLQTVFPAPLEDIQAELLSTGRWEGELKRTTAQGTTVVVAARYALRRDEQTRPVAILETSNDITQRKRRQKEIENLNLELAKRSTEIEAINKELEAFAYSVSHDLRAPLRHIAGFTELLHKKVSAVVDEKSNRYIAMILDSAKRMGNLIDDLLAFSRIGRAETKKTEVDLEQLVEEVVAEIEQDTKSRDIAWKIGALPVCYGDRSMLRLVVVNLVSNAVKFTRMRRPAQIEIGCVDRNKKEVEVFVRDNGAGFEMQYVNKLFGVFERLHPPEQLEGTGIGLATVQRIIHRHGGKVRGEGSVDQGATFYFSLPKAQDAAERTANAP